LIPEEVDAALDTCMSSDLKDRAFDLLPYINSSALSVPSHFSIQRAYTLFRTMGLRSMTVVNTSNEVVGIITRKDLMDFKLHDVIHPHGDGHDGHDGHDNHHVTSA